MTQLGIELNEDSQKGAEEILAAPLSECGIAKSGLDLNCSDSVLTGPLIVEIKEYEDITQPKQRFEDDKSREVDVSMKTLIYLLYIYFLIIKFWIIII